MEPSRISTISAQSNSNALLISPRHIPGPIHHLLLRWQKLVEVLDTLRVLIQQLRFAWDGFAFLDEVEDGDGRAVALEEVVEVLRRGGEEWVDDTD